MDIFCAKELACDGTMRKPNTNIENQDTAMLCRNLALDMRSYPAVVSQVIAACYQIPQRS